MAKQHNNLIEEYKGYFISRVNRENKAGMKIISTFGVKAKNLHNSKILFRATFHQSKINEQVEARKKCKDYIDSLTNKPLV